MLWYAGYGSNLDPTRFSRYLDGGTPPGARRATPGARDATPPRDARAVVLPGAMFFGWHSPTWNGAICFYDATAEDRTYARAHLVTEEQFVDVAAQEMHREPASDLDLSQVLRERRHSLGPGRYETLHLVGELDGLPMLTFTAADPHAIERRAPAPAYLALVARGLRQTHGLDDDAVVAYLASRPGMGADGADAVRQVLVALAAQSNGASARA